jgi:HSP20 family molecular chaperone IbpA
MYTKTLLKNEPFGIFSTPSWLFDETFLNENLHKQNVRFLSNQIVSKIVDGKLEIAISVLGHDPKAVNVELTEDKIFIKAEKGDEDKSTFSSLVSNINETLKLSKDYNGLSAKATINNGILNIVVDKKDEAKPKKLSIKF